MPAANCRSRGVSRWPLARSRSPARKSSPLWANVAAERRWLLHFDDIAVARGQFLDHHRVGGLRQHTAGKDARGFAGRQRRGEWAAGGDFANHFKSRRRARHIGSAHGVSVHGRHVGRRLGTARLEIVGEHAAVGIGERHFVRGQRLGLSQNLLQRLRNRQQRHDQVFLRAKMAALAAALLNQPDAFDAHAALDRLDHVVDGEAGDRHGGQCFHLDAGLAGDLDPRGHGNARQLRVGYGVDLDLSEQQRVAERDQFVGALGRHDAGNAGGAEHVALLGVAAAYDLERFRLHQHTAFGDRHPLRTRLGRHVDHACLAAGCSDATVCWDAGPRPYRADASAGLRASSVRVAAATSSCRIRLSPTRKVEIPTLARRARSAGDSIPLSPTKA